MTKLSEIEELECCERIDTPLEITIETLPGTTINPILKELKDHLAAALFHSPRCTEQGDIIENGSNIVKITVERK
ncbi:MAG: hypothetical protein KAS32_11330 [Candidatus Peribacteraceae bacterium]|nr:hypothetical protein [Candidatus Peribacteraceae bacterium]